MRDKLEQRSDSIPPGWVGLFGVVFSLAHLYVLLEWVFIASKASFLDVYTWPDKLQVLFCGATLLSCAGLLGLGGLILAGRLAGLRRHPRLYTWLVSLLPATMLGALMLLLVDNSTYTLFSFGIASTSGAWRGLYTALFVILCAWADWEVLGAAAWMGGWLSRANRRKAILVSAGAWLGLGLALTQVAGASGQQAGSMASEAGSTNHPHILWVTVDGLSAESLSLYGYVRDTTPNLRALAETALVADNAFANADKTAGSLVAMFTGKNPLQTRVLYLPDILLGAESYQHLPGLLRAQGYYAIQYGFHYYVDAYSLNMLEAFDEANGRTITSTPWQRLANQHLPSELVFFGYATYNRIADRLGHIFFIQTMPDPTRLVVSPAHNQNDNEKIEEILGALDGFEQPMFIHLHLLAAHGPTFQVTQKVFSRGLASSSQGEWNRNFYDDAILGVDANIGRLVSALEENNLLDDTLLVVTSDHATRFDQLQRIPLLIRFPGGEPSGRIETNVQGLDIAPTILDYLGLPQPDWMAGQSLLGSELETRLVIGVGVGPLAQNKDSFWVTDPQRRQPPFYQIGSISVVDCQRWYELDLVETRLTSGEVRGHSAPCAEEELLTPSEAYAVLLESLVENGFEVETLEQRVPEGSN